MAMAAIVPPTLSGGLNDLLSNKIFMSGFFGFLFAQVGKVFTERYKRGYWDLKSLVGPGGMPSSHSSLCSGVTTSLAMVYGLGSPMFAVATAFTLVVMYDAMGVRRHAGMHAQVLNRVVDEIQYDHSLGSVADLELKEVLGHTPRQVVCGALLGIAVGILYPMYF